MKILNFVKFERVSDILFEIIRGYIDRKMKDFEEMVYKGLDDF